MPPRLWLCGRLTDSEWGGLGASGVVVEGGVSALGTAILTGGSPRTRTYTGSDEEAMAHLLMYSTNYTVCRRALYAFAHALRGHLQHHVIGSWFHCRSSDRKLVPLPLLSLHDIPSSRRWPRHSQRRRAWWDAGFWIARILTALFVPVSLKARATQSYVD